MARPVVEWWRRCSISTGMTIAVDDRARAAPMAAAGATSMPNSMASPVSTPRVTPTWAAPSPKTSRRMSRSRSQDSSSPIMNSRKTTPSSASWAMSSGLSTVK